MAKKSFPDTPPWESFEVVLRGTVDSTPFSDVFFSGDGDPVDTALRKMWLLQFHGWPLARTEMRDPRGKQLRDKVNDDPDLWLLKSKPSCWRLYFYVYPSKKIVYLYAVCKKKQKRNSNDGTKARSIYLDNLAGAGDRRIVNFTFPED